MGARAWPTWGISGALRGCEHLETYGKRFERGGTLVRGPALHQTWKPVWSGADCATRGAKRECSMRFAYHVLDVFTRERFGGNPLAVVLDADGLPPARMQMIAREFNLS